MTVRSILDGKGRDVVTISPLDTLGDAARLLAQKSIGAVIVTDGAGGVAGILSERDIVRAFASGGAASAQGRVSEHMTAKVITCVESISVDEVMRVMTTNRFRHLPVVEDGRLVGVVSIGDVVKRRLADIENEHQALRDYIATA